MIYGCQCWCFMDWKKKYGMRIEIVCVVVGCKNSKSVGKVKNLRAWNWKKSKKFCV